MKILFAAADRDLLVAVGHLLQSEGYEVESAFDGAQVLEKIEEAPDLLIFDRDIPRVGSEAILQEAAKKGVPVILLTAGRKKSADYLAPILPAAYLYYPFGISDLLAVIREVTEPGENFPIGGLNVFAAARTIGGRMKVTAEEVKFLREAAAGTAENRLDHAILAHALNEKFKRLGRGELIRYETGKGYEVVS